MSKEFVDVLVIGAGPSGCVSSSYLKKNNVNVKVVEKTKFPRLVVGESLIPRVMDHFDEAGLFPALDKMGFEKKLGARFLRGDEVCIFDFSNKFGKAGTGPGRFRELILIILLLRKSLIKVLILNLRLKLLISSLTEQIL